MTIDGVTLNTSPRLSIATVHAFSDELKSHLEQNLSYICFGRQLVQSAGVDDSYYSFEATMDQFAERYLSKDHLTRLGMAGELLVHLLTEKAFPDLSKASIYFNKEERSIKKGFDLTYLDGTNQLWFAEVKSGEATALTFPNAQADLANRAMRDLRDKFASPIRRTMWDNAIFDAQSVLQQRQADTARKLLRLDTGPDPDPDSRRRVVLATPIFYPHTQDTISSADAQTTFDRIEKRSPYADLRIFAIQKSTLEKISSYIAKKAKA